MFKNLIKFSGEFNLIIILVLNVVCSTTATSTDNEYFSSISGLENLFKTEVQLLTEMKIYINNLNQHIDMLQSEINSIQQEHNDASKDLEGYLNNPINSYRLIKRLYTDWPALEESVTVEATRTNYLQTLENLKQNLSFPTQDDMVGSTMALVRLQKTYQLDVAQVASGILNGVKYGSSMSWQDCYLVGEYLFAMEDYNHTIPWLKQSTKMLIAGDADVDLSMTLEFLETIAEYHKTMGDHDSAMELIEYILQEDKDRKSALETKTYLEEVMSDDKRVGLMYQENPQQKYDYHETNEFKLYEKVCRGEFEHIRLEEHKNLYCKYHSNNHPYRILQPYKLEELSLDPYIIYIYDVISDHQLEVVKMLAQPYMKRSKVFSEDGLDDVVAKFRTSKTAWFEYDKHKYMTMWLRHVQDITGLNTNGAEDLQIANYGLGGHYEPHWDFFTEDASLEPEDGNRISTAIFYLSDVEEGGATAFPFLHLRVKPQKGAMLFWYNLHSSGDRDYRTKHAACPVLKGSKWIANVWIKERHQFHEKPCDLTTNHDISLIYKDYD